MIDREAFAAFHRASAPGLERLAARLAGSRAEAEEVVQEAYYRYLRSGFTGASDEERRRYLYRIALNLLKTRWRRVQREGRSPAHALSGAAKGDEGPDPGPLNGVGEVGRAEGERLDVRAALRQMRPRDRALLWLAYVEGFSHREVGAQLRLATASVRVLLFRARKRFVNLIQGGA